jgi:hypothetical protein
MTMKNANGHNRGERTRHPNPDRNLNEAEIVIHAGGLILSARRSTSFDLRDPKQSWFR